jgi:hypothetical protein
MSRLCKNRKVAASGTIYGRNPHFHSYDKIVRQIDETLPRLRNRPQKELTHTVGVPWGAQRLLTSILSGADTQVAPCSAIRRTGFQFLVARLIVE